MQSSHINMDPLNGLYYNEPQILKITRDIFIFYMFSFLTQTKLSAYTDNINVLLTSMDTSMKIS